MSSYFITTILYYLILKLNHSFNKIIHLYTCLCYLHCVCQTHLILTVSFKPLFQLKQTFPTSYSDKQWQSRGQCGQTYRKCMKMSTWPHSGTIVCTHRCGMRKGLSDLLSIKELGHTFDYLKLRMQWSVSIFFSLVYCFLNTNLIGFLSLNCY